mgnify:CR=1 FL=1
MSFIFKKVIIYISEDKEDWKEIASANEFHDMKNQIALPSTKSKFIKLVIKSLDEIPAGNGGAGGKPWTFIDEIIIN